jgi:CelD/BcsL family acetyltransferase involved in cellulose biosynthesis
MAMRSVLSAAAKPSMPAASALASNGTGNGIAASSALMSVDSRAAIAVELVEDRALIPLTAAQWNELVAHNETNSIFQTYEWFDAWWRTFGDAHDLFFLLLRREGKVIGFGAMMLRRMTFGMRRLEFVGTGNADYQDFVVPHDKQAALNAICAFLRTHSSRWRSAWFSNVPSHSSTLLHLHEAGSELGLHLLEEARLRCPSLQLAERQSAEKLLKKYSLKRPLNWFSSRGEVRFRNVTSLSEIQALLPTFFEQHASRWRAAGRPSLFDMASQRTFYLTLAVALHSAGWLLFSIVEFNGQPIAFHFGFDYGGSLIWYKPSFDVRYAEHSPGLLLTRKIIEDGLQRSKRELDFTIGEEAFKDRFANVSRFNVTLSIYHDLPSALRAQGWRWLRRNLGRARRRFSATSVAPAAKSAIPPQDSQQ